MRAEPLSAGSPTTRPPRALDGVVSHHMNPYNSGVARFNQRLAEELGIARLSLSDAAAAALEAPLLSFKVGELGRQERTRVSELADAYAEREAPLRLFLHAYDDLPLETRLVEEAVVVYCGNHEIRARLHGSTAARLVDAWAPGLIADVRRFEPATLTVFSFGMAHKLRVDMFRRLRELLEASGESYVVRISNATHETSSPGDEELVFADMRRVFPRRLYFMGHLADVTVYNELLHATFFATFFERGVRANNTSVASAMEHGAVVITNLDEHSPPELVHMRNVIDIERCDALPTDPLTLRRIGLNAMETARERSWERLAGTIARDGA